MSKERILVIPGGFVPYNDTVTLLTYKHLRNIDAEFDVVALKGKEDPTLKQKLEQDPAYSRFHVQYVCDYDQAVATFEKKNVISGLIWFHRYCKAALKQAQKYPYKVVYTSSVPAFTHLAGYWIKKKLGSSITWVASMSDPLYHSPYKHDTETIHEYSLIQKIGFYVYIAIFMNSRHEKLAQKYSDRMIYICPEQRDFSVSQYPEHQQEYLEKSMTVSLNYLPQWDQDMIAAGNQTPEVHHPLIYSHLGRVYGLRKIDAFLQALIQLKKDDPKLAEKIQFNQYGEIKPKYRKLIQDSHLEDVIHLLDKVTYEEAEEKMIQSDGLILFDTIMPDNEIQPYLPSKAIEYMLLRKDLLIISTPKSPAWRIFTGLGYDCCRNDTEEVKKEIQKLMTAAPVKHDYDISMYENTRATAELKQYIESKLN
jgi:glycosyltransferase involved in cell wall biosynthesis